MSKIFIFTLLFLIMSSGMVAEANKSLNLSFALTIPVLEFDDFDGEKAGSAYYGFGIGAMMTFPVTSKHYGVFVAGNYFYTTVDLSKSQLRDDLQLEDDAIIEFPSYKYIPISFGMSYQIETWKKVFLNFNAGLTYNFLSITDFTIENKFYGLREKYIQLFDDSNAWGFRLGSGIKFSNGYSLSLNYFSLGVHEFNFYINDNGRRVNATKGKVAIDILVLTAGFDISIFN